MSKPLYSAHWYRVADLRLRLRGHVEIHRHQYRGVIWRIVEDRQGGRFHRLSPAAHHIVCMMDGARTMSEIWEIAERRFGRDIPTQDEVIRLLAQLHAADLLIGEGLPDFAELDHRASHIERRMLMSRVKNPMALRFPVLDPDRLLTATLPLVRPLFSYAGALAWIALVATGIGQAIVNWPELTSNLSDRVLAAENLLLIALVYPLVKMIHELGHAYAVKRWGGEVHDIGVMLLVFFPVPYVDASSSQGFHSRWNRATVGAAGILVEMALAAAALIAWTHVEPGLVRAALFNVILIGGVSTLLFNGNPLLRFDGYYVLADLIGIPNLATRGNKYIGYLVQKYAFGVEEIDSPVVTKSERGWLFCYAVLSFLYRISVMIAIALFIASKFFFVGVLLALLVVFNMVIWPVLKAIGFVVSGRALQMHRWRSVLVTSGVVLAIVGFVAAVPLPHATIAEGVVWLPQGSVVRAQTAGEIVKLGSWPGTPVKAGDVLVHLADPRLDAELKLRTAQLDGLSAQYSAVAARNAVESGLLLRKIEQVKEVLELLEARRAQLDVRAPLDGVWVIAAVEDLTGRFVGRGDSLGHVVSRSDRRIRAVVTQDEVDLVRNRTLFSSVRLVESLEQVHPATIVREVPAGDRSLPSPALATTGGGSFAPDPQSAGTVRALEPIFQFELLLDETDRTALFSGARVYVRFDHGEAPLLERGYRAIRRLFLKALNV